MTCYPIFHLTNISFSFLLVLPQQLCIVLLICQVHFGIFHLNYLSIINAAFVYSFHAASHLFLYLQSASSFPNVLLSFFLLFIFLLITPFLRNDFSAFNSRLFSIS
uniref:Uncharacterized protein n=1 Tax=Cacopsylla melanoneura TaxID=428564 RepID=A0A8D8Z9N0_9HEMI